MRAVLLCAVFARRFSANVNRLLLLERSFLGRTSPIWQPLRQSFFATSRHFSSSTTLNLSENNPEPRTGWRPVYTISVATGDERGAGADTNVTMLLHGARGTLQITLSPKYGEFRRDSVETFQIEAEEDIGELKEIVVQPQTQMAQRGWFLKHVDIGVSTFHGSVDDPEASVSDVVRFKCDCWLGAKVDTLDFRQEPSVKLTPALKSAQPRVSKPRVLPALSAPLTLRWSVSACPHPKKVKEGARGHVMRDFGSAGEDAYTIDVSGTRAMISVADGVYEWIFKGINSGEFSQGLSKYAQIKFKDDVARRSKAIEALIQQDDAPSSLKYSQVPSPMTLFQHAWNEAQAHNLQGSSTFCVATFDGITGLMRTANLGDSGLLVFRGISTPNAYIKFRTRVQEHRFGQPYQLGHHSSTDHPWDASIAACVLKPGDVIVAGSDGLWDNLKTSQLLKLLQEQPTKWNSANDILKAAFDISVDKNTASPWSEAATEELNFFYSGGKADDITVIVAEVVALKQKTC